METAQTTEPAHRRGRSIGTRKKLVPYYLLAPGGAWLLLLLVLPLLLLLYTSLESGGILSGYHFTWAFSNYTQALSENGKYFARSLTYAGIVTVVCLLLAFPMTYWIAFYGGRWKSSLLLLMLLPFFVSYIIRTIQWKFILADNGIVLGPLKNLGILPHSFHVLATPLAVVAGIIYDFIPFTALPLYVALERIDRSLVEAAKDLYSTRWQAFRQVVIPLSLPGMFAAFLLTFVPATGDYVNASILGGPGTTMIGNIIQTKFLVSNLYGEAAAISAILMIGMFVLVSLYARVLGTEEVVKAAAG